MYSLFVYLDVFLRLNFVWINNCQFFKFMCHTIGSFYAIRKRSHLEILALTSWYPHWHCKILSFSFLFFFFFFWNIRYGQYNFLKRPIQLLISLFSSFHQSRGIHWCCRKSCLNFEFLEYWSSISKNQLQ